MGNKFDDMVLLQKPKFQFVKSYYNGQQNGLLLIVLVVEIFEPSKAPRFDLNAAFIPQRSNFQNNTAYPMQ